MTWFLVRRLGLLVVALFVASVMVFALLRLVPGDLAVVIAGTEVTPERLAQIRADLGLDRPLLTQYFDWMGGVLTGDFGESALTGSTVAGQLGEKLTVTAPLVISSTIIALAVAVPLGVTPRCDAARPTESGFPPSASSASPCPSSSWR